MTKETFFQGEDSALNIFKEIFESKNIDDALEIITKKACALVGGRGGSVWLQNSREPDKIFLRWTYHSKGPSKIGESYYTNKIDKEGNYDGITGWVFATGNPICLKNISDMNELSKYQGLKWKDKHCGFKLSKDKNKQRHYMAVPIYSCRVNNKVIGVLRIGSTKTDKCFSQKQFETLKLFSGYISGLLTNFIKQEEERLLLERFFTVAHQSDQNGLLDETVKAIPEVLDGSDCSIFLRQKEDGNFYLESTSSSKILQYTRRNSIRLKGHCISYKPGSGKTGSVAETGKSIRKSGDISSETGMPEKYCEGSTSSSFLCIAIKENNVSPIGVLRVIRDKNFKDKFDEKDQLFLERIGNKLYQVLVKIVRSVEFLPEHFQSGISIMSFFGTVLKQIYPESNAKVYIEQDGLKATMTVDPVNGHRDIIEKILDDYGAVICGKKGFESFSKNQLLIIELKTEIKMANMRLEMQKDLLDHKNSLINELFNIIGQAMITQRQNVHVHNGYSKTSIIGNTDDIIIGQDKSSQTINKFGNDFEELINQFKHEISKSSLSKIAKQDLDLLTTSLKNQTKLSTKNSNIIDSILESIQSIIQGAAGSALFDIFAQISKFFL